MAILIKKDKTLNNHHTSSSSSSYLTSSQLLGILGTTDWYAFFNWTKWFSIFFLSSYSSGDKLL